MSARVQGARPPAAAVPQAPGGTGSIVAAHRPAAPQHAGVAASQIGDGSHGLSTTEPPGKASPAFPKETVGKQVWPQGEHFFLLVPLPHTLHKGHLVKNENVARVEAITILKNSDPPTKNKSSPENGEPSGQWGTGPHSSQITCAGNKALLKGWKEQGPPKSGTARAAQPASGTQAAHQGGGGGETPRPGTRHCWMGTGRGVDWTSALSRDSVVNEPIPECKGGTLIKSEGVY